MIIFSSSRTKDSPADSRVSAFKEYFSSLNIRITVYDFPASLLEKIVIFFKIIKSKEKKIFISMPPFKNFWVFFIPGVKVILDIRDGWSIAMDSGYGGTSVQKKKKALIARMVEKIIINRSYLTITCTPGLQNYLEKVSNKKVILIPNGILESDHFLSEKIKLNQQNIKNDNEIVFCCAGKFSEYGKEKITILLKTINDRFKNKNLIIKLIGSDQEQNQWVIDFFKEITNGRGSVMIIPRSSTKSELYSILHSADYGLTILRNPDYEFGTKIYDYISLEIPVINYFSTPNNFTDYFDSYLDVSFKEDFQKKEIRRKLLIENSLKDINFE